MRYLKLPMIVISTCFSFLSATTATLDNADEQNLFAIAAKKVQRLTEEWSIPAEEFKASIDAVRAEILGILTEAQSTTQTTLQSFQTRSLSPDEQFAACEAAIAQQEVLMRAITAANETLEEHLWNWIDRIVQEQLCPLYTQYASGRTAATESSEASLANIAKQLSENDFMRLARKSLDLETTEMLATLYAIKDDSKAAYAKFELDELVEKAKANELSESEQQRKAALENFTVCIRYLANTAQALTEIQLDTYGGDDDNSLEKIALRNRASLTTAWAITAEQAAETPSLLALSRFLRHETAHAVSKKFLETFSPALRRVNYLRVQAMACAFRSGITADQTKLFLTNTNFLRLDESSLTALLGDDATWLIQTRNALRLHPGFSEEVFLPDQLFDSLLTLSTDSVSHAKFPLPDQSQVDAFVTTNAELFANARVNPVILQAQVLGKLKSKFAETLPADERPKVFALQNPYESVFQAFVEAQPEEMMKTLVASVTQELLPNARYTAAHNHLLAQRKEQALAFIRNIQSQFFDAELDFEASGIDPLSDFGRLWARYHAVRDLTSTLNAETFKQTAHEFIKVKARLFFSKDFTTSTFATAPLEDILLKGDFWADSFTNGKADFESQERLRVNLAQTHATHDLLASMPDSTAKQLATKLLGTWVTASVGKPYDEWVEAGRDALAIAYLQTQKYLPGTDEFKIWTSVKQLADALATTKEAEKQALADMQKRIGEICAQDETRNNILETYVSATGTIFNLDPNLGMAILSHAIGAAV
jgi:hypothetical protein